MKALRSGVIAALIIVFCALAGAMVLAAEVDEAAGVNNRRGDASPAAGFSTGETNSRVDDYIMQDEQINIDGSKDAIVKVLRVNQKNLVNDFVVGVFPINNAQPREIRSIFRTITAKEGGRAEVIRDKVGGKAYLQVICPRFQLPFIEAALRSLDESWVKADVDGGQELYYKAKWRDVANINTIASVPGASDGGTTVVDTNANAIWMKGEPYRTSSWLKIAELIDVFPPQVLLDATVYEVELTNDVKLGLDYVAWKNGPGANLFRFVLWGFDASEEAKNATSMFNPFIPSHVLVPGTQHIDAYGRGYYASAAFLLSAEYMDFMVRKGRARVVTSGRLTVRHNQSGTLALTDEVIHFTAAPTDSTMLANPATVYVSRDKTQTDATTTVGLTLTVTPQISLETTELAYTLVANDLTGMTRSGTPILRTANCAGTVLVRDGVRVCVGGLRRTEKVQSNAKMPILGSIPVLGYLFGGEQNAERQSELVVVLTPHVVQCSEVDKELARAEDNVVRAQAQRRLPLETLKTEWGFDQWLLHKN